VEARQVRHILPLLALTALAACAETYEGDSCDGGCDDATAGDETAGDAADETPPPPRCGDGVCSAPAETPATCPGDCAGCSPIADVTALIGANDLFFGYAVLGTDSADLSCGALAGAREVAVTFTPTFTGDLVLSTRHPSTRIDTVLEVREGDCRSSALACNDLAAADGVPGSRLTLPVESGTRYVALVETADDEAGVFALGLHRSGVCEGLGNVQDVTASLLTGVRYPTDTSTSTASLRGGCGPAEDNPESLFSFIAPRSGTVVATTVHPATTLATVLYARQDSADGADACDSPEAESACADGGAPGGLGTLLRFDIVAGRAYDLFVDGAGSGASGSGLATLTLGYAATSPARAALQGCSHTAIQDQFAFFALSGQAVHLKVDTVDAATAADTRLRVRLPDGTELYEADDDFACTYPPPSYSCPEYTFTAATAGLYTVEIYVGTSESCRDRTLANYELTVTVDGVGSELILLKDQ
jgi:hypothetical protein